MFLIAEIKTSEGQTIAVVTAAPKDFKTVSKGYHGTGKGEFDGKRYQIQLQLVEIGSKKATETES